MTRRPRPIGALTGSCTPAGHSGSIDQAGGPAGYRGFSGAWRPASPCDPHNPARPIPGCRPRATPGGASASTGRAGRHPGPAAPARLITVDSPVMQCNILDHRRNSGEAVVEYVACTAMSGLLAPATAAWSRSPRTGAREPAVPLRITIVAPGRPHILQITASLPNCRVIGATSNRGRDGEALCRISAETEDPTGVRKNGARRGDQQQVARC